LGHARHDASRESVGEGECCDVPHACNARQLAAKRMVANFKRSAADEGIPISSNTLAKCIEMPWSTFKGTINGNASLDAKQLFKIEKFIKKFDFNSPVSIGLLRSEVDAVKPKLTQEEIQGNIANKRMREDFNPAANAFFLGSLQQFKDSKRDTRKSLVAGMLAKAQPKEESEKQITVEMNAEAWTDKKIYAAMSQRLKAANKKAKTA
jgi:hypothetical protein